MSITEKIYYMAMPHPATLKTFTAKIENKELTCAFCNEPARILVLPHVGFSQQDRNQLMLDDRAVICENCLHNQTPDELEGCYLRKRIVS